MSETDWRIDLPLKTFDDLEKQHLLRVHTLINLLRNERANDAKVEDFDVEERAGR